MNRRNSNKRKFRPRFDALECKQLLSAGLLIHAPQALVQAAAPSSSQAQFQGFSPNGTGKGIVIITSG